MTEEGATLERFIAASRESTAGGANHRAFVGPPAQYDFMGATQFRLLTALGIREEHRLLDVGCGSLRAGRFLIQYLMPRRYCGIEPNHWLIEQACEMELGADLFRIKQPRFDASAEMRFDVFGTRFDYIVAQSIFSHTGRDLFGHGLVQAAGVLADRGQLLFTVLSEGTRGFASSIRGADTSGWVYPSCTTFREAEVDEVAAEAGLHVQRLDWFHPRQRWFRAVRDAAMLLAPAQAAALGTGAVLFDPRFPSAG